MTDPDWNNLKVALAVARGGSLTRAAQLLGLDQTTAGRRLTALETQLGTALFVRSKTGILPTDDGRAVIEYAARIEDQVTRLTEGLANAEARVGGVVRIMGNTWMLERMATHLPALLDAHPALEIRFSGRLPPAPLHGEPTVSFWFDAPHQPPEVSTAFARVPYSAFAATDRPPPPTDWVQFRDDDAAGPSFSREMQRRLGPEARVRLTATDARILISAIRAGLGHGVLPNCLGDADPALTRSGVSVGRIERVLRCHVTSDAARLLRVRTVIDWAREVLPDAIGAALIQPSGRNRV
ncbi:LysR family transcriptional regulator [Alphaproteobacteria bacterium GH1-50]|uniref:LysR family transcriptional regulator n=1 Tax=Kangsaoukella pontilimi TaxID=2691042 RepID=A0A7C9IFX6_9RHOB|nr:LysR family transcriptional regulator [Kangsaoukella pontilimi]MXQ07587.1 LysR family transcriptional regulator [Kangsaoukella pontilimi]